MRISYLFIFTFISFFLNNIIKSEDNFNSKLFEAKSFYVRLNSKKEVNKSFKEKEIKEVIEILKKCKLEKIKIVVEDVPSHNIYFDNDLLVNVYKERLQYKEYLLILEKSDFDKLYKLVAR